MLPSLHPTISVAPRSCFGKSHLDLVFDIVHVSCLPKINGDLVTQGALPYLHFALQPPVDTPFLSLFRSTTLSTPLFLDQPAATEATFVFLQHNVQPIFQDSPIPPIDTFCPA